MEALKIYQDVDPDERERTLMQMSDLVLENEEFDRPLTHEEQEEHKNKLTDLGIKLHDKEEEFKRVKKAYSEETTPLKKDQKELLTNLSKGTIKESGNLYGQKNFDDNTMEFYNSSGEFVRKRALRSKERNLTIQSDLRSNRN